MDILEVKEFLERVKGENEFSLEGKYIHGDLEYMNTIKMNKDCIGQELVKRGDKLMWGLNYYGVSLCENLPEDFTKFLEKVIKNRCCDLGLKRNLLEKDYESKLDLKGDVEYFQGEEKIYYNSKLIYKINFQGGSLK